MIQKIMHSLESLPPLELEAVSLLAELQPQTGSWFPTELTDAQKQQVVTATVELVAYTQRCRQMVRRLSHLEAVPLSIPIAEFAI